MKFIRLTVKKGLLEKEFNFENLTLITSKENSVGKTSLVRMLLYSIGYPIPPTAGLNFENYSFDCLIETPSKERILVRREKDYIELVDEADNTDMYSLPIDHYSVLGKIFGITNYYVLENLLGAFYFDQEKGWTLLNRGKIIGKIPFNIERLIAGLSNRSIKEVDQKIALVEDDLAKYKMMGNTALYQRELLEKYGPISKSLEPRFTEDKEIELKLERQELNLDLKKIEDVIKKNRSFMNYVSSFDIRVTTPDGLVIPVNENTVFGFKDQMYYLLEKRKLLNREILDLDKSIERTYERNDQDSLFPVGPSIGDHFNYDVMGLDLDQEKIFREISSLESQRLALEESRKEQIKTNNPVIDYIYNIVVKYTEELKVNQYISPRNDYIFTNKLKGLSGVILHKIVFSFKLSYILAIRKYCNVNLPIVIDSPRSKEITDKEIERMMAILPKDFSDHQVIIASLYNYGLDYSEVNFIKEQLLGF